MTCPICDGPVIDGPLYIFCLDWPRCLGSRPNLDAGNPLPPFEGALEPVAPAGGTTGGRR